MVSLFHDTKTCCDSLFFVYSLVASKQFIDCADKQLTEQFIRATGLKPGKNVSIAFTNQTTGAPIYSQYQIPNSNMLGRKLSVSIYINHNWNPVTIYWKSKIGRDYKLHDNDIECSDIEFWFEHLDTDLYIQQLFPHQKIPFQTDNLTFELEVVRLKLDATLTLTKSANCALSTREVAYKIDNFIARFNEISEKQNRKHGVVHHWKTSESDIQIRYDIDLGSAGILFYKHLFDQISKLNCISKILIE